MKTTTALKKSLYYHLLGVIPTLLGLGLVGGGLWVGTINPVLTAFPTAGVIELLSNPSHVAPHINPALTLGGLVGGYAVYRLGRTALLFKLAAPSPSTDQTDSDN